MFELSFRDERYLPFESRGASRWRIELPHENNFFDIDTVTDVVLHLNYTAREGGDVLRKVAMEVTQPRLLGNGWRLFDIQQEFPQALASVFKPYFRLVVLFLEADSKYVPIPPWSTGVDDQ